MSNIVHEKKSVLKYLTDEFRSPTKPKIINE